MCKMHKTKVKFEFGDEFIKAFEDLKKKFIEAPILIAPNWELTYKLM